MDRVAMNVEIVANPDEKTMQDLIHNAQVNILVTFQAMGLKLKLLNVLFNGRYCVVNDKMVAGLDVGKLCYTANDPKSIRQIVTELMKKSFDREEMELRREKRDKFYNLKKITDYLLNLIYDECNEPSFL